MVGGVVGVVVAGAALASAAWAEPGVLAPDPDPLCESMGGVLHFVFVCCT